MITINLLSPCSDTLFLIKHLIYLDISKKILDWMICFGLFPILKLIKSTLVDILPFNTIYIVKIAYLRLALMINFFNLAFLD